MFRLRTLGTVSLEADGTPLSGRSTQRRRLALLALLAAAADRGLTRDKLLAYLWPERNIDHARHSLSQTLYAIRNDLGDSAFIGGIDELRLNPAVITSDLAEFRSAIAAGDTEHAAAVHCGPFLDGFFVADAPQFERWADEERSRIAAEYRLVLESLARSAEQVGNLARAVHWWRRRANTDPLNGQVALSLMRTVAANGDRAGALQHARVHAALLREEMDAPPDPAVEAFAEELRAARSAVVVTAAPPSTYLPYTSETELATGGKNSRDGAAITRDEATSVTEGAAVTPLPPDASVSRAPSSGGRWSPARWRGARPALAAPVATGIIVAAIAVAIAWSGRAGSPAPHDRGIVLAEIRGPDTVLALAVQEALRAELSSAADVQLVGEFGVRETLRLMAHADGAPVTGLVARDVAQRQGAAFVIAGSASPLGTGAQLVAELIDVTSGVPVATLIERPATDGEVIAAVTRLARDLRAAATGAPVSARTPPLPAVTTASLPALQSYSLARRALADYRRAEAIMLGEAALVHDSLFALAHYLVGDQLWFLDDQRHGESHLSSAFALSDRLPPKERLLVRARYTHIVLDRPDSALAYWRTLRAAYPDEPLAYEGIGWAFRALALPESAAIAAGTALRLDPTAVVPNFRNRVISLLELGDTTAAFAAARWPQATGHGVRVETRFLATALFGGAEGVRRALSEQSPDELPAHFRHSALVALGSMDEATALMEETLRSGEAQTPPRVLIAHARGAVEAGMPSATVRGLASRALRWIETADLSAPAYVRLGERIAEIAARTGDTATIADVRRLLLARDAGRGLPSYRSGLAAVDASGAFARGDMRRAATLAEEARGWPIFARSVSTLLILEADARRALGEHARAESLYRAVLDSIPFHDGDIQTVILMRPIAAARLRQDSR